MSAPRYCPLVLVICALAAGIIADRLWPLDLQWWWLGAAFGLAAWTLVWRAARERTASCVLTASILAVGGAWHHCYWRLYAEDEISRMVDETVRPIVVEAVAITSPRWVPAPPQNALATIPQGDQSELLVRLTAVRDGRQFRPASGWATLDVEGDLSAIRAGDHMRVMAQGVKPNAPLNPGEFDFSRHERSRRVGCRLFAEFSQSVTLLARGSPWSPRRWLADIRNAGTAILRRHIAPERATLASAILLGAREQLDPHRNEDYLVTGTIHVLSISGLHVGILATGFFVVLRTGLIARPVALLATIVLTVAYALLTDMQPPVVRATILVAVACLALWVGRHATGINTLACAGIVVLTLNPASLFQAGPQLSFLAVATMIAFQPVLFPEPVTDPIDRLIARTRPFAIRFVRRLGGALWRVWLAGALIWLIATPLVWRQYNRHWQARTTLRPFYLTARPAALPLAA